MEKPAAIKYIQRQHYAHVVKYTDVAAHRAIVKASEEYNKTALNPVVVLSDIGTSRPGEGFRMRICGMEFRGFVIDPDANLSVGELEYLMSRMRIHEGEEPIYQMDQKHKSRCAGILEENYRLWANNSTCKETADKMGVDCDFSS